MVLMSEWLPLVNERVLDADGLAAGLALEAELRAAGLPWGTTVASLLAEHGPDRWFDFTDVVRLAGRSVLGLPPLDWFHHLHGPADVPVDEVFADVWLAPTVADNHAAVRERIERHLGPGLDTSVSNTIEHTWWVGTYRCLVRSFPPERRLALENPLEDRFPELRTRATVEIAATIADTSPDPGLPERFAAVGAIPLDPDLAPATDARWLRRHEPLPLAGLAIWADDAGVAVSASAVTAIIPRAPGLRLTLTEMTPARGGGSAELDVEAGHRRLELARSGDHDGLRDLAAAVSERLGVELHLHRQPDE